MRSSIEKAKVLKKYCTPFTFYTPAVKDSGLMSASVSRDFI